MKETFANLRAPGVPLARKYRYVLLTVIVLAAIGTFVAYRAWAGLHSTSAQTAIVSVSEQTLADEYGLRIKLVAVTAAGGLIDLRFQVLDKEKAGLLLGGTEPRLVIVAEDSGTIIQAPPDTRQSFDLEDGMVYFVQLANTHASVQPGSLVSIVMGNARVKHVVVQ